MANPLRASASTELRTAPRQVYSYSVEPLSLIIETKKGKPDAALRFLARLSRKDGSERKHKMLVENSIQQPTLVQDARLALQAGRPLRMLVSFERIINNEGEFPRMEVLARLESIPTTAPVDQRQIAFQF